MINSLLSKLEAPRRHLAFLVGLLALVFVLAAVVAWRASEADRRRIELAENALHETAALTLGDWSRVYQEYVGRAIEATTWIANPTLTIEELTERVSTSALCPICASADGIRSIYVFDPATGHEITSGGQLSSRDIEALKSRGLAPDAPAFHEQVHGALQFIAPGDSATGAFVYLGLSKEGAPARLVAVVPHQRLTNEILQFSFTQARRLPGAFAPEMPSDNLFAWAALAGRSRLLGDSVPESKRIEVGAPVYGLTLSLGPRDAALAMFNAGAAMSAERATIFVLMVAISALLITAIFQLRRDAELARLRSDFVAGVTHELRTPLAQIRMFTETLMLGRVRSDVERRRSLEIIDQEARRLAHLVENVLLFSKAEGGRTVRLAPEPTHFAEEIRHAVESLSLLCRSRSAEVRTELQENITVPVDRMALRQILVNLVDNALKYGPAGQRITVGAALFDDVARIWVDDEGPGIPAEERARVFESFYRIPRESQSRIAGSGIGLAVVRELARLHGGTAWVESAPMRGARIVVEFPDAQLRSEAATGLAAAS